jgi:hypothetical protein
MRSSYYVNTFVKENEFSRKNVSDTEWEDSNSKTQIHVFRFIRKDYNVYTLYLFTLFAYFQDNLGCTLILHIKQVT